MLVLILLKFFSILSVCFSELHLMPKYPEAVTHLGHVRGHFKRSFNNRYFAAFEGIPYAKPPVGNRRFAKAEPVDPWTGTWQATSLYECSQTDLLDSKTTLGQEDCLYINVYTPRIEINQSESLDVIVHIHGGGFAHRSGHYYAHPEYIMDHDVIFVTFNYRLGILGFLSTEDDVVPGNNGLKDQTLALKWVQQNIQYFGGNPNSVTLTGLSAGGASVHYHYLSPLSKGLFHRGMSNSGVVLNMWALHEASLKKVKILAVSLGCPDHTTREIVDCLQERPVDQILKKITLFQGFKILPFSFGPVLEVNSTDAFLTENPYQLLDKGQVLDIPWIVSSVAHEGIFPAKLFNSDVDLAEISKRFYELMPVILDYNYTLPLNLREESANKIRNKYFGSIDAAINSENYMKLVQLISDRFFLVDTELAVKKQAKVNKSPVYYYWFSYAGEGDVDDKVEHAEDGQYFFYKMFQKEHSPNDLKMKDLMLELLISYSKTGVPIIDKTPMFPTSHGSITYTNISGTNSNQIYVKNASNFTPINFWSELGLEENQNLLLCNTK